ncbi:ATP-binding protein [Streptomyces tateyamensis]|uniref:histidine kinase n=1 Tax=Streptomyces tateyamensis TaxID=565073 RepID=A0A2V4NMM3_9ACTN|nr:ATP-binding protein [Streptomyces tateyamensis]PYC76936.1 ATP-binding protein [Streptomyces tateyamensis]
MTARSRLSGRLSGRSAGPGRSATLPAAFAALLAAAAAVAVATAAAPAARRWVVALWAGVGALAWCAAVGVALAQRRRARQLAAELATARSKGEAAVAAVLRAESATATAVAEAQAARARANAAHTDAEAARVELLAARAEAVEARAEAAATGAAADDERAELVRLAEVTIPEVVRRLRAGASVETVLVAHRQTAHEKLLGLLAREIAFGERQRAAALAVCATAAGRVQALATSMHAELREMQHRHGEDVLGDLLLLDHSTAQAGRLADSIAVLTGARSGRRWARPIPVESVLRGALGRIGAYQRVRLHSASTAAVAGYAAEGVMHVLAELMDNAANFSAPPAEVHVYVEELHSGLAITVEDGGLGLSEVWLRRAEQAVSGEPLDLTTLSAGTRLGLAVVGALARKHGLAVSFRPSSRGGTGVVVRVPEQLITHQALEPSAELTRGPAAVAQSPVYPAPAEPAARPPALETEAGLPKRRRGQTLAAATGLPPAGARTATASPVTGAAAAGGDRDALPAVRARAAESAGRFGAFRQAARGPHPTAPTPSAGSSSKDDA